MSGLTQKQRVKVNAALSMIYDRGYDAQTVVTWAKGYERKGYDTRRAYEHALNEFIGGQPDLAGPIGKINRLIEASDVATVSKYAVALSKYIESGDDTAIAALGPMIARDSVALAIKHGELDANEITAESVQAATGFAMADDIVTAAAQPQATPPTPVPKQTQADTRAQVSPFAAGGRTSDRARMDDAFDIGGNGPARTLTGGQRLGTPGIPTNPSQTI